jgi:hypothetical protein
MVVSSSFHPLTTPQAVSRRPQHHGIAAGAVIGSATGAAVGAAAGGMIGGPAGAGLGAAIGVVLGIGAGAVTGHAQEFGADHLYRGDPRDLIGYLVRDRAGHRVGKVVSAYVVQGLPIYLGISTVWINAGYAHLIPVEACRFAPRGRKLSMLVDADVIDSAPTVPLHIPLDVDREEALRQYYEPRGITIDRWRSTLRRNRRDVVPEPIADVEEVEVELSNPAIVMPELRFSGDAPYGAGNDLQAGQRPTSNPAPSSTTTSGRRGRAAPRDNEASQEPAGGEERPGNQQLP